MSEPRPRPPRPLEVRRSTSEKLLKVRWSDGHESVYEFAYLRGWCPCAGCQGHGGQLRYIHADNTDLAGIEVVGHYALGLKWGDGHDTGIYSYRHLRELCRCAGCVPAEG